MQEFEIIFYDKADGTEPAKEFIESLDDKMRARVLKTIALLAKTEQRSECHIPSILLTEYLK